MMRNKRVLAIAISLLMAISVLPGMAFAAEEQSLEDYTGLQQGTTSTRIYMLNCGDLEETFPAVFGDDNEYASRWDIKTDTSKTEWFDNYIMDAPDTRAEVEFVFSIGGGGMNNLSDDEGKGFIKGAEIPDCAFKTGVADHVKVLNASGGSQPRIISMIFTPHSGSGGGTGGGPSRAVDVIVKIAPNTLNANETYKLALTSGLSSGRDALDKDIYFTFTTAPILVEEITFGDSTAQLKPGETKDLTATVLPENATDKNMTWTSSDESVAKVSGGGTITAVNPGKATITAMAQDGSDISAACQVTVVPILTEEITLGDSTAQLKPGETKDLTATVLPENATDKN
ncbi:MAG: Ig domain-containing protein, partial [Firmicutes bacterium]|nr:Ig domain-containing protein [Bacillota bacterium]